MNQSLIMYYGLIKEVKVLTKNALITKTINWIVRFRCCLWIQTFKMLILRYLSLLKLKDTWGDNTNQFILLIINQIKRNKPHVYLFLWPREDLNRLSVASTGLFHSLCAPSWKCKLASLKLCGFVISLHLQKPTVFDIPGNNKTLHLHTGFAL